MIIQNCTEERVLKMALLAVNTAEPMGMGFMQYTAGDYKLEDVKPALSGKEGSKSVYIDYFYGRMTKFSGRQTGKDTWEFSDHVSIDYQSWCGKYPTYQSLYDAVK